MGRRFVAVAIILLCLAISKWAFGESEADQMVDTARKRWAKSPHGAMLERILPPAITQLPDPQSRGARLLVRYYVQCHHLPNPAMHDASRWPRIVDRVVNRIDGKGNMAWMNRVVGNQPDPREPQLLIEEINAFIVRNARQN